MSFSGIEIVAWPNPQPADGDVEALATIDQVPGVPREPGDEMPDGED